MFNVIAYNTGTKEIFKNLKIGDVLTFKDLDILIEESKGKLIKCGWNDIGEMDYLIDEYPKIIIDEERYDSLRKEGHFEIDRWMISLDMLKYANKKLIKF